MRQRFRFLIVQRSNVFSGVFPGLYGNGLRRISLISENNVVPEQRERLSLPRCIEYVDVHSVLRKPVTIPGCSCPTRGYEFQVLRATCVSLRDRVFSPCNVVFYFAECVPLFKKPTSWDEKLAINTDEYVNFWDSSGSSRMIQ